MLQSAALVITNSGLDNIAIPVLNFPVLPPGSKISLYLANNAGFENGVITEYVTRNDYGALVIIDLVRTDLGESAERVADTAWSEIRELCVPFGRGGYCEYVYPHWVDYSPRYPIPLQR